MTMGTSLSASGRRSVTLPSGELSVTVQHAELPLETLCGFASRRSTRRGFVFVSKVLGKHWPVRPSMFDDCCRRLAARIEQTVGSQLDRGPAIVVGMAETATGLGHGIFEALLDLRTSRQLLPHRCGIVFIHGTRYRLSSHPALAFEETHSHATSHWLHRPESVDCQGLLQTAETLIIVDDEQSTGRTAGNLAVAMKSWCPGLQNVVVVCLTDFMSDEALLNLQKKVALNVQFVSLLKGGYEFEPNPEFSPPPTSSSDGDGRCKTDLLPSNFGRLGLSEKIELDYCGLTKSAQIGANQRVLVLGTGEFQYPAFCWARSLESRNVDVVFQSTTRSPLMVSGDLGSALEFEDNYHDGIPNFLYNVSDHQYDRIFVMYETDPWPHTCKIPVLPAVERMLIRR
ncbi:MAG: phosphoribosyltransferase domain-containing protein [Planctomyces sp.]|nr:phosphoribosyltransferase domain-containing protein [Planctomyces sp.]